MSYRDPLEAEALCRGALAKLPRPAAGSPRGSYREQLRLLTALSLADVLSARSRSGVAETLYTEILADARSGLDDFPRRWPGDVCGAARLETLAGGALAGLGRLEEAEALLLKAYPVLRKDNGPASFLTRRETARLVRLYEAWGKPAQAAEWRARIPVPRTHS